MRFKRLPLPLDDAVSFFKFSRTNSISPDTVSCRYGFRISVSNHVAFVQPYGTSAVRLNCRGTMRYEKDCSGSSEKLVHTILSLSFERGISGGKGFVN